MADDYGDRIDALANAAREMHSGESMVIRVAAREGFQGGKDFLGAVVFLVQRQITFTDVCRRCY